MRWIPAACLALGMVTAGAAAAAEADPADALRQKDAEVQELRRRLEQAEKELEQLRRENQRLRQDAQSQRPVPATPAAAPAEELRRLREENERLRRERDLPRVRRPAREPVAVRPLAGLPPLTPETVVEVDELLAHFQADAAAAAARYAQKIFRVRGVVDGFQPALMQRRFAVLLGDAPGAASVACRFNYVDRYRTVFASQNGQVLKARFDSGREVPLLERGQIAVVVGRCRGVDADGVLVFDRCELVR